jgi:hypothetical protein
MLVSMEATCCYYTLVDEMDFILSYEPKTFDASSNLEAFVYLQRPVVSMLVVVCAVRTQQTR